MVAPDAYNRLSDFSQEFKSESQTGQFETLELSRMSRMPRRTKLEVVKEEEELGIENGFAIANEFIF